MKKLFTLAVLFIVVNALGQGQFQKEVAGSMAFASGQVMQLAAAIPADKYDYTPQEGVRNVAQVCAHIVSANYFFASKLGAKIPEGVKMETLETDLHTKEKCAAELKKSYEVIIGAIKNTNDGSLAQKVEFPFPGEFTGMSAALIALSHTNEHLGQLIAYSRSNQITPPWSKSE